MNMTDTNTPANDKPGSQLNPNAVSALLLISNVLLLRAIKASGQVDLADYVKTLQEISENVRAGVNAPAEEDQTIEYVRNMFIEAASGIGAKVGSLNMGGSNEST
ncbi:hypothetical protein [Rhodoferax sp.]|uniref:hypothetical protein n=1 Tax=Rhodoferax sp. TaxID=50421 RepID=UPI00374D4CED